MEVWVWEFLRHLFDSIGEWTFHIFKRFWAMVLEFLKNLGFALPKHLENPYFLGNCLFLSKNNFGLLESADRYIPEFSVRVPLIYMAY